MGKNSGNSWLNAVKKAFRSPSNDDEKRRSSRRREENEQQEEEKKRVKKRWIFRKNLPLETTIQHNVAAKSVNSTAVKNGRNTIGDGNNLVTKDPKVEKNSLTEQRRTIAVAMATAAAAEAAVATAQAAVEIARLFRPPRLVKEHKAAIVIQTIFRGYLARRALLALKGVVKLQALIRGHNVRKRAKTTLQCIRSLVRVQALVCDQRRRLSFEATSLGSMLSQTNNRRKSSSENWSNASNNLGDDPLSLEEIQALIQKAKECSLKQGKTLAHASSQQMWRSEEDQFSINNYENLEEDQHRSCSSKKTIHPVDRKDSNLCNNFNQRDPIKTLEIDTSIPYSFTSPNYSHKPRHHEKHIDSSSNSSPLHKKHHNFLVHSLKTPSSSRIKPIQARSWDPHYNQMEERLNYQKTEGPNANSIYLHRMSMSENPCPSPRPNYMGPTASAMARIRSHSTPRLRVQDPNRVQTGSAKKRLLFGNEQRENVPYYYTE